MVTAVIGRPLKCRARSGGLHKAESRNRAGVERAAHAAAITWLTLGGFGRGVGMKVNDLFDHVRRRPVILYNLWPGEKQLGIDRGVVQNDRPMQMRACDPASGADCAKDFALFDWCTVAHVDARHVHVGADQALAVVDKNRVAIEKIVTGIRYHTIGRGFDRCAGADRDIEPGMRVAGQAVENSTQAET